MVREYPVKKGIKINAGYIAESAEGIAEEIRIEGEHVLARIPGMKKIELYTDGKKLLVETETDESAKDYSQTVRIYNDLIEKLTGYNSKERKKRLSKA